MSAHTEHTLGIWQILVESNLLNVIILAGAIIYLGNKFLPKVVDERKKQISKELEDARIARTKANEELEVIKQKIQHVALEIEEIKEEAKKTASTIKEQIEQETDKELEGLRIKIKKEIISRHSDAIEDIKRSTGVTAIKLAEEALSQLSTNKEVQDKLLKDFLSNLDKPSKN